jgi:hypothetical protein
MKRRRRRMRRRRRRRKLGGGRFNVGGVLVLHDPPAEQDASHVEARVFENPGAVAGDGLKHRVNVQMSHVPLHHGDRIPW